MSYKPLNNPHVRNAVIYSVIGVAVAFYLLTIRSGHNWGGDFALYISHAINIATGHPYADTGFVFNPRNLFLSPQAYPPVYPAFLAIVYQFFGLDIHAMKVAGILVFALFLVLFSKYAGSRLGSPVTQILLVAAVAFSPWLWESKDRILPDYLFILFLYGSVMLLDRLSTVRQPMLRQIPVIVLTALVIYLAYGTRSVGLLIVPALIFHDVIRRRLVSRSTLIITVLFCLFYYAQNANLHIDNSYFESMKIVDPELLDKPANEGAANEGGERIDDGWLGVIKDNISVLDGRIPHRLYVYGRVLGEYWYLGERITPGIIFLGLMSALAITGFIVLIGTRPSFGDYFMLTYAAVLLVVPFEQDRYLLPMVPLYLLYIFRGAEQLSQFAVRRGSGLYPVCLKALPVVVSVLVAVSYISSYTLSRSGPLIARGVESNESLEMFEFVRENIPDDSLFVFYKPRPLALFTGKRAAVYHWEPDLDKLWRELDVMGVTHIVLPKHLDPVVYSRSIFPPIVDRYRGDLDVVFENRHYVIYAIRGSAAIDALP